MYNNEAPGHRPGSGLPPPNPPPYVHPQKKDQVVEMTEMAD